MAGDSTPDMQPVLRCRECSKPFDKESTLKRHLYYCRSRRGGPNTVRPRSCQSCAKAKTACDSTKPQCSRCRTKTIACHYPVRAPRSKPPVTGATPSLGESTSVEPGNLIATNPLSSQPAEPLNTHSDHINESNADGPLENEFDTTSVSEFVNFEDDYLDWNDTTVTLPDFLRNTQEPETNKVYLSPISLPWSTSSTPMSYQTMTETPHQHQYEYAISPSQLFIPMVPTSSTRSLTRRPKLELGAREQRITNLILHTLKSYPLMMLRQNTLPPFIHPALLSSDEPESVHMEAVINCMNLVNMISNGGARSRKLFWKNVQMECERLSAQRNALNKWQVLAAMQAVFIYILIRVDEGEKEYNDVDVLLVRTVVETATQLAKVAMNPCAKHCPLCNNDLDLTWKEWIFRESKRRLAIVYRVVNMLVYFEPATMCSMPREFILGPLPCRKTLWEARDELSWMGECLNEPGIKISFGLDRTGDIVKLDEGRLSCNDAWLGGSAEVGDIGVRSEASWEEWCAGIDGLGGLVMLAASLVP